VSVSGNSTEAGDAPPTSVLHVLEGAGGREVALLVGQLRQASADVVHSAVVPSAADERLIETLRSLGVAVHVVPRLGAPGVRGARALRSLLAEHDHDVVHVHAALAVSGVRLAVRTMAERRRPAVVHPEHDRAARHLHLPRRHAQPAHGLDELDRPSAPDEGELRRPPRELHLGDAAHGIDVVAIGRRRAERTNVRRELGIGTDALVVGIHVDGRRDRSDGLWLEVADTICDASADVHFVVIGTDGADGATRARVRASTHRHRIHLPAPCAEATRALSALDVFAMTGRPRGVPVVLLEALALGLPVVAAAVDGVVGAVRHGVEGLLVAPGDRDAFVSVIEALLADAPRRARLGAQAAARAEEYDTTHALAALETTYRSLASGRTHRPVLSSA
jgi:glycosyltransferase involved in cell wall biosynthesis